MWRTSARFPKFLRMYGLGQASDAAVAARRSLAVGLAGILLHVAGHGAGRATHHGAHRTGDHRAADSAGRGLLLGGGAAGAERHQARGDDEQAKRLAHVELSTPRMSARQTE